MAGIPLLSGFNITSDSPADTRLVLTKAEMKAMKDTSMPQTYFCTDSESGDIYVYNKTNEVDATTGKFRLFKSGGVEEVSELPEEPGDNVYNVVSDKKVYEDLGSITTTLKYDDVYGGELMINKTSDFVMDINGTEYNIHPTTEAQYLIGDEASFPRMAYVLYGTGDKIRVIAFTQESITYTFKAVTEETAANEVYSKNVKLVTQTELDNIGATAVLEKTALPSDIKNYVYKISSGDDSGAVINTYMTWEDMGGDPSHCPANAGVAMFILPKDKMINIDHISASYNGFSNRPNDWTKSTDGEYSYYNMEPDGYEVIVNSLPAMMVYRESSAYQIFYFGDKTKSHYFETDATVNDFVEIINIGAGKSVVLPQDYNSYGPDGNFENPYSLDSDFSLEDIEYKAATRTMTCKNTSSATMVYLKRKEGYINKLSSDSFNKKYNTWNILSCEFNEPVSSIIVNGDEFTTDNDYYHNITDGSSGPTALPAYAYIKDDNTLFVWQSPSDGIFAKPSTNKIWYELDTGRDADPMYIPSCVTRIKDKDGTVYSTTSDITYTDSSMGFTYVSSTRMLTITGSSSDITISFEVPATVGEMVIVNGTKVYAKDVEVVTKKEFDTYKESLPSFDPDKYVDKDSAQTVTGKKTFTSAVDVNEVSHTDSATSLKIDIKLNERLLFSAKKNDDHEALMGMTADANSSSIALSADSITLNNKNVVTSVDGVSSDVNGNVASKFGGYEADFSTENTTDTWVPVLSNGKMQHRVIPATLTKTVNGSSPDTNGNIVTDNLRSTIISTNIKTYADSLSATVTGMYVVRRIGTDSEAPITTDADFHYTIYKLGDSSNNWTRIVALNIRSNVMYQCAKTNGTWSAWAEVGAIPSPLTVGPNVIIGYGQPPAEYTSGADRSALFSNGVYLAQKGDETAGIALTGNNIIMWCPPDSDFIRVYNEDNMAGTGAITPKAVLNSSGYWDKATLASHIPTSQPDSVNGAIWVS